MRNSILIILIAVILAGSPLVQGQPTETFVRTYAVGYVPLVGDSIGFGGADFCSDQPRETGIGPDGVEVVCIDFPQGMWHSAFITIQDSVGIHPEWEFRFETPGGGGFISGGLPDCRTTTLSIPSAAGRLLIDPVMQPETGCPVGAVHGTVTAVFT